MKYMTKLCLFLDLRNDQKLGGREEVFSPNLHA